MKLRTILLYSILLVLVLALVAALVWPFLNVESHLSELLVNQFRSSFEGTFEVGRVSPGFNGLNLYALRVKSADDLKSISLAEVNLNISLLKLIQNKFNVVSAISSVTIRSPKFNIYLDEANGHKGKPLANRTFGWSIFDDIKDEFWLKRVSVRGGSINLFTPSGQTIWSIQRIEGTLSSEAPGKLMGDFIAGAANYGQPSFEFHTNLDTHRDHFESSLSTNLSSLMFADNIGLPAGFILDLDSLSIYLDLSIDGDHSSLAGKVELSRVNLSKDGQPILYSNGFELDVNDWRANFRPAEAEGMTAIWNISGQIADLRRPEWDLRIQAYSESCDELSAWLPGELSLVPAGIAELNVYVSGPLGRPTLQVSSSLQELKTPASILEHLLLEAAYTNRVFVVDNLYLSYPSGAARAEGLLTLPTEGGGWNGSLHWQGNLPGIEGSLPGDLDLQLHSSVGNYFIEGSWLEEGSSDEPVEVMCSYLTAAKKLNIEIALPTNTSFLRLDLFHIDKTPEVLVQFEEPISIVRRFYDWDQWDRIVDLFLVGEIQGTFPEMTTRLEVFSSRSRSRFIFDGPVTIESVNDIRYVGDLEFQQGTSPSLIGLVDLHWKDKALSLYELELDDAIYASGGVDFQLNEFRPIELLIDNWDLSRGLQLFWPEWAAMIGGVINGRFELYGPLDNPTASLNLYASRGYIKEQSDFWMVFSAEFNNKLLTISECNIGQSITSLIRGRGQYNLRNSEFDIAVNSSQVDASKYTEIAGLGSWLIGGPLSFEATLKGTVTQPAIHVYAGIVGGRLYKMPFGSLSLAVRYDSTTAGVPIVESFKIFQSEDLTISGEGGLPITSSPTSLKLIAEGNVLKIPSLIDRWILDSRGEGLLRLEIRKDDSGTHIGDGRLRIRDGFMKFPDVVKEIDKINADVTLQNGQVHITDLSGEVDRLKFAIANRFNASGDSTRLQHMAFESVGLDLGIVNLETEGRGLLIRIPSLMPTSAAGYLGFRGKEEGDKFTFAGPVEHLNISGRVKMSKAILTYPFAPLGHEPSKFVKGVLQVLEDAVWDVKVEAERDNRYIREIRTDVGTPLLEGMSDLFTTIDVNLNINPGLSRLNVLGSLSADDFRLQGSVVSTRGSIEYLDLRFSVDQFEVEFDEHDPLPWVEGRGETVYTDSLGLSQNVYLTLYVVDPITGERFQRGRWGDFIFIMEDDAGSSQEQILAAMGYSPEQITDKMTTISGQIVSDAVLRRWIRPIERELETVFRVDLVKLQPTFARHLFESQVLGVKPGPEGQIGWGAYYLNESQLSVGKYFTDEIFISYTGLYETAINAKNERDYGFVHRWAIEYRVLPISRNLTLNFEYEYDSLEQLRDRSVMLRYSFLF